MFIRLLVTSLFLIIVVQSAITNSSTGQAADALTLPKQASTYDDYDLNDHKTLPNNVEGSGGAASLDEYADDEEEEQLSKVTASTVRTSVSIMTTTTTTTFTTTTTTTTVSTSTSTTTRRRTFSTTSSNRYVKTTSNYFEPIRKRNQSSTTLSPAFNDLDGSEFKDDQEEYADDLEDDAYYNEPTVSNKVSPSSFSITRYPVLTTRQTTVAVNHTTPIWMLFTFLTRPPIAAGILAGKSFFSKTGSHYIEYFSFQV